MPTTTARELAEPVEPIAPRAPCAEVFDRLLAEPGLLNIPVVEEGRPVGLVSRQDFLLVYVRLYGREIYGRQPVTALMNAAPVVVEATTSCDEINARLVGREGGSPLQGFIVADRGRYVGVGSSAELMRALAEINMRRAEELERQRRRAEAASESKTQFLAGMSHELRTPLNAIIGFADLMRLELFGRIEPECYVEYVRDIHGSGVHLLHMINELLDMAKIEAGRFDLHEDVLHPAEICDEVTRMLRQSVETARVRLDIRVARELPHLVADEQQMRRILVNLLSNAIKFTPAGGSVTLSVGERTDGGLEIAVADTGIGIPPDKIEKVLEPFEQVENSFTRTRAGTGLGLPLTKAMVEAHGGRLRIESVLDKGTRVRAIFPPARVVRKTEKTDAA